MKLVTDSQSAHRGSLVALAICSWMISSVGSTEIDGQRLIDAAAEPENWMTYSVTTVIYSNFGDIGMRLVKRLTQVLFLFALMSSVAFAATLEEAKAAGQIGEKQDGYIGFVQTNVPADVAALVADVNAQRRERYQQIARENGIDS